MARRKAKDTAPGNVTKERLAGTPFSSMAELNAASKELRSETWRQVEKAKIKRELLSKDEYKFFLEPFRKGMVCRYGEKNDSLVRVYLTSDGGIQVDINEEMKSTENSEALLSALIKSTSDSLFSNYLKSMDIIAPADGVEDGQTEKRGKSGRK
jgi:hypothetical protein